MSPAPDACFGSDVTVLEEPSTVAQGRVVGEIQGPGKARVEEASRPCTVVILFSETDLEEPFTASEGIYIWA
jgi:hypothetical protein